MARKSRRVMLMSRSRHSTSFGKNRDQAFFCLSHLLLVTVHRSSPKQIAPVICLPSPSSQALSSPPSLPTPPASGDISANMSNTYIQRRSLRPPADDRLKHSNRMRSHKTYDPQAASVVMLPLRV